MKTIAKVINGEIEKTQEMKDFLLKNEGELISLELKKPQKTRTTPQNNWYWATISDFCQVSGMDKKEVHEILKYMLLPYVDSHIVVNGVKLNTLSTTTLTVSQYIEFLESVKELILRIFPDFIFHDLEIERIEKEYSQEFIF